MNKLWIFGDSFSCDWSNTLYPKHTEYAKLYNPEHFKTKVSSELNLQIVNKAVSGYCNQSILESIGISINDIDKDDYVVVGWSDITRWRNTSIEKDRWTIVASNFIKPDFGRKINPLYKYECANRDGKLVGNELNSWIDILKKSLPVNTLYWTPFQQQKNLWGLNIEEPPFKLESIKEKTGIEDYHMTSESHTKVGEWMVNRLRQIEIDKSII
jgi:hypothetical protein